MRSAPQSRLFFAVSLINAMVSTFTFGFFEVAFDLCFQKRRASLTVPPQKGRLLGGSRALASRTASLLPEATAVHGRCKPFTNASSPGQTRSWRSLGEIGGLRVRRSAVFSPRWISLPLSPCAPSCLQDLLARPPGKEEQSGGMFDRQGNHYLVF